MYDTTAYFNFRSSELGTLMASGRSRHLGSEQSQGKELWQEFEQEQVSGQKKGQDFWQEVDPEQETGQEFLQEQEAN